MLYQIRRDRMAYTSAYVTSATPTRHKKLAALAVRTVCETSPLPTAGKAESGSRPACAGPNLEPSRRDPVHSQGKDVGDVVLAVAGREGPTAMPVHR